MRGLGPAMLAGALAGTALGLVFGLIGLVIAAQPGVLGVDARLRDKMPAGPARLGIGAGIGGRTIGVPVMTRFGVPIHIAVATASRFGLIIAVPGTLASSSAG